MRASPVWLHKLIGRLQVVVDFAFGGFWRNGIKKPEQLPLHVPALLWTQLLKLSDDMISTCYRPLPSGDLAIPLKALKRHFQDDLFHDTFLLGRG